jgi:phosphoglycolate phosphatase
LNEQLSKPVELIIFDLDGTLIDTAPEIAAATNDFLEHYGWPRLQTETVTRWIGRGTRALLAEAIANAGGGTPETIAASQAFVNYAGVFDRYYDEHCGTTSTLFPDVRNTLQALADSGIGLAIVTNKERRYTERVLSAHGLLAFFDPIISGDSLASRKPNPAGVLSCLQAHATEPRRALFVGDSRIDAITARNAGLPVWLLPYGYNMGEPVAAAEPNRVLEHFAAIRTLLDVPQQQPR